MERYPTCPVWVYVEDWNGNLIAKERTCPDRAFKLLKATRGIGVVSTRDANGHQIVFKVYR